MRLPTELIRRVAGYTSYPTHLALSRVSRRVRAAVVDWAVYRAIVDNGAAEEDRAHLLQREGAQEENYDEDYDEPIGPWKWNPITSAMPIQLCARYAWMDHQARNLPPFERFKDDDYVRRFTLWAGALVARRHPFIAALGKRYLRGKSFGLNDYPDEAILMYTISFCRSAAILSAEPTFDDMTNLMISQRAHMAADDPRLSMWWSGIMTALHGADVFEGNGAGMHRSFEGTSVPRTSREINESYAPPAPENWMVEKVLSAFSLHEVCVRTIGVIGYRVRGLMTFNAALADPWTNRFANGPGWGPDGPDPRIIRPPPTAYDIPFDTFMDLPDPGAEPAEFVWCHLHRMATREFLEAGKWMGVYTYRGMNEVDPPMIDIRFRAVDLPADDSVDDSGGGGGGGGGARDDVLDLTAAGFDGIGDFTLYGKLYRATGKMVVKKTYSMDALNGQTWEWLVFMTPFGIVGRWGDRFFGGYIWLWKEDCFMNKYKEENGRTPPPHARAETLAPKLDPAIPIPPPQQSQVPQTPLHQREQHLRDEPVLPVRHRLLDTREIRLLEPEVRQRRQRAVQTALERMSIDEVIDATSSSSSSSASSSSTSRAASSRSSPSSKEEWEGVSTVFESADVDGAMEDSGVALRRMCASVSADCAARNGTSAIFSFDCGGVS
ncbi:hypothetical protein Dda_0173 [Drechslerella dactyloides]|uniref:F-box domain-containing protein n=1 Tax=Drechslerella dactyloides TaxID=74499 RepID=A0AAD6J5R5_DREDA|nr:hypothetical protein Dda_0173 [Drechslerella dactyloides]